MTGSAQIVELTERPPTSDEIDSAAQACEILARSLSEKGGLKIAGEDGKDIRIAPAISALVLELLSHVANGDMVTLVPTGAQLTTQQAADLLNVSRPYFSKLLKQNEIPFVKVGTHRRVALEDLLSYKANRDRNRRDALKRMAGLGQEYEQA